ncbi:hypothetical protein BGZ49_000692, partial [Haplosporangium sp. Z 27]
MANRTTKKHDELIEAVIQEQGSEITDEEDEIVNEMGIPQFIYYYQKSLPCPRSMIVSRQNIVDQEQLLQGHVDMQGIIWHDGYDGLSGKEYYRACRNNSQEIYYVTDDNAGALEETRNDLDYNNEFYQFRYTDTNVQCSHRHPQLRNLVCATNENAIRQWSPQLRASRTILGYPLKSPYSNVPRKITTMAALDNLLLTGGEDGSFTFINLETCKAPIYDTFTNGGHMEVNGMEISYSRTGKPHAFISTNDYRVRCVDMSTLEITSIYPTDWFVNYTSQSPDGHMIALVGDHVDGIVMSVNSRDKIATLKGHQRYSFSVAWSPDSQMLATGSDDHSTCLYDTRMMSDPVRIISKEIQQSVRSLRYSSCGKYLVMAEDRDYVHIVDTASDYTKAQKIDFIGDISGISLTPDGEGLYIGVSNTVPFSSILEFERVHKLNNDWMIDDDDISWGNFQVH